LGGSVDTLDELKDRVTPHDEVDLSFQQPGTPNTGSVCSHPSTVQHNRFVKRPDFPTGHSRHDYGDSILTSILERVVPADVFIALPPEQLNTTLYSVPGPDWRVNLSGKRVAYHPTGDP